MLVSKTYPLDENNEFVGGSGAMALVTLSHTPAERRLYAAMLNAAESPDQTSADPSALSQRPIDNSNPIFTVRRLKGLAGTGSLSTIRRGLEGLVAKLSVEREADSNGSKQPGVRVRGAAYRVFTPEEVIARRDERGFKLAGTASESRQRGTSFQRVIHRVLQNRNLSHREVQVVLCCVEGLTNAEIGSRLQVTKQTVKFHLRNIFVKFGVKRRAALISRLLM